MTDRNEQRLSLVALQLGAKQNQPVGAPPSDEELAALLELRLDPTRRAQVLSHLLADERLYARWFALREGLAWIGEAQQGATTAVTGEAPLGWFGKMQRLLFVRPAWSGAFAAALLVVMLVPAGLRPDYVHDIDRLYADLPGVAQRAWPTGPVDTQVRSMARLDRGPLQTQLELGLVDGMDRIDAGFSLPGIDRGGLAQAALRDRIARLLRARRAAFELGRFGVLATISCQIARETADFPAMLGQLRAIRADLPTKGDESATLQAVLDATDGVPDPEYAVCVSAARIVESAARGAGAASG